MDGKQRIWYLWCVLPLLMAGCGSGDETSGPTGDAVRIGYISDYSGPSAVGSTHTNLAADMAVHDINEAGGILGRPLALVKKDWQGDIANLPVLAQELLDEGVTIITLVAFTTDVSTIADVVEAGGGTLIVTSSLADTRTWQRTWALEAPYALTASGAAEVYKATGIGQLVALTPASQVALVNEQTVQPTVQRGLPAAVEAFPDQAFVNPAAYDFKPHLEDARALAGGQGTSWVLSILAPLNDLSAKVILQYLDHWPDELPHLNALVSDFTSLPTVAVSRLLGVGPPSPYEPQAQWFTQRFISSFSLLPGVWSTTGYDLIMLPALAIASAGTTDPVVVSDTLPGVSTGGIVVAGEDARQALERASSGEDIDYHGPTARLELSAALRRDSESFRMRYRVEQSGAFVADPDGVHCVLDAGGQIQCVPMTLSEYLP